VPVRAGSGPGQMPVRRGTKSARWNSDHALSPHVRVNIIPRAIFRYPGNAYRLSRQKELRRRQPPSAGASPSSTADGAFLTAIAIAQPQKARSFELRAALALAKLYQATKTASPKPTRCSRPCSTDSRQRLSSPRSSRGCGRAAKRVVRVPSGRFRPLLTGI
jgi:hypothetical protein